MAFESKMLKRFGLAFLVDERDDFEIAQYIFFSSDLC